MTEEQFGKLMTILVAIYQELQELNSSPIEIDLDSDTIAQAINEQLGGLRG